MRFISLILALAIILCLPKQISKELKQIIEKYYLFANPLIGNYLKGPWLTYLTLVSLPAIIFYLIMCQFNTGAGLVFYFICDCILLVFCLALHESNHALLTGHLDESTSATEIILDANSHLFPTILTYILLGPIMTFAFKITDVFKNIEVTDKQYNLQHVSSCVSETFHWASLRITCLFYALISDFSKLFNVLTSNGLANIYQNHDFSQKTAEAITSQAQDTSPIEFSKDTVKRGLILLLTFFALYKILFGIR